MEMQEHVLASGMRLWVARPDEPSPRLPSPQPSPRSGEGAHPVMMMLHERYGPVEHTFNVLRRTAEYGFVACMPDMFHRYEGDRGPLERSEARCDPTDAQYNEDIDETIAFLRTQDYADASRVGIVGFCQTGRVSLVYAASGREVAGVCAVHGGIYPRDYEPTFEGQESADTYIPRIAAPILGCFGENDNLVPLENVRRFRGQLDAMGARARIHVYADTPHAWMNSTRPETYVHDASERTWEALASFFSDAFEGRLGPAPNVELIADAGIEFDFSPPAP